jgi:hypothetical protein
MDRPASNGGFQTLNLSGPEFESEPARVRSVESEHDDVSMLFLPFKAHDHQTPELVPDLSAGTAGSAIPAAGSAPTPAARYLGGSVLPAEAPPPEPRGSMFVAGGYEVAIEDTALLVDALAWRRRSKCPGARSRASRGRPVRRRGSRRATATRAGPDDSSGDPEPGPSSGHVDHALAGRPA